MESLTSSRDERGGKKRRGGVGAVMNALDNLKSDERSGLPIGGAGLRSLTARWNKRSIEF